MRFLLLIIAIGIGFWIFKHLFNSRKNTQTNNIKPATKMVRCEHCNVHIPYQQAIQQNDKFFCCEMHSKQNQPKD